MGKRKLPYKEGDWFAVPLREGAYALGLIARSSSKGKVLFGYFFGPMRRTLPCIADTKSLTPADAVLIGMFGDLDLFSGRWPLLGSAVPWNRSAWPMPFFVRTDSVSGKCKLIEYSEDDPNHEIRAVFCDPSDAQKFPPDRLMGSGAVVIHLEELLF